MLTLLSYVHTKQQQGKTTLFGGNTAWVFLKCWMLYSIWKCKLNLMQVDKAGWVKVSSLSIIYKRWPRSLINRHTMQQVRCLLYLFFAQYMCFNLCYLNRTFICSFGRKLSDIKSRYCLTLIIANMDFVPRVLT